MESTVHGTASDAAVELPRSIGDGLPLSRAQLSVAPLRTVPRPDRLSAPITALAGVGSKLAASAAKIGITTIADLIEHVPHSHLDRATVTRASELKLGEPATLLVEVRSVSVRPTRRRHLRIVEAIVSDGTGPLKATWFNQAWLAEKLRPGTRLLISGRLDARGFRVDAHELLGASGGAEPAGADPIRDRGDASAGMHTTGLVPVHPLGDGLRASSVREWAFTALAQAPNVIEALPARLRRTHNFAGAADARLAAHFPATIPELAESRRRLAYEELFLHQAALAVRRRDRDSERRGRELPARTEFVERWLASLPFEPTGDQRVAFAEIDADLQSSRPMQRLLMGEVGSGKTVVALYAMLRALESGSQAALMAPTETLAEQHFATLEQLLAGSAIPAALLTGSTTAARRRDTLAHLATGELGLIVGTHALIEPAIQFARLAVAVVDEQHRFGVEQRRRLDEQGPRETGAAASNDSPRLAPHTLHMTATPIPRTLSLTAYGDLDTTTLRELPAGRRPIKTWVVGEEKREGAYGFIRDRLREGRQAYVVCALVSESETTQAKAAETEATRLATTELADFEVQLMHGQMPAAQKGAAMARFAAGEADVLVATTVIEVGIDVANASVMLIEDADRYGLSQLHQLRGRIGRGEHESHCILFADPESERARLRLEAIQRERDGFELAEVDLMLRGEGEVLGTRQSGLPRFRVARLPEDGALLAAARDDVMTLLKQHGSLDSPGLGPLIDAVRARFGDERAEPIAA